MKKSATGKKPLKAQKTASHKPKQAVPANSIRMNINIPRSFHKQIKQRALDEEITVTELVSKAVEEYLGK